MKKDMILSIEKFNEGGINKVLPVQEIRKWIYVLLKSAIKNKHRENTIILFNQFNGRANSFKFLKSIKNNFVDYIDMINEINDGSVDYYQKCLFAISINNIEFFINIISNASDEEKDDLISNRFNELLTESIESGNIDTFKFLVEFGESCDYRITDIEFLLHIACSKRNYGVIEFIKNKYKENCMKMSCSEYCIDVKSYDMVVGDAVILDQKTIMSLFYNAAINDNYNDSIEFTKKLLSIGLLDKLDDSYFYDLIERLLVPAFNRIESIILINEVRKINNSWAEEILSSCLLLDNELAFSKMKKAGMLDLLSDKKQFLSDVIKKGKIDWLEGLVNIQFQEDIKNNIQKQL